VSSKRRSFVKQFILYHMSVLIVSNTFLLSLSFNLRRIHQDINLLKPSCKACIFSAYWRGGGGEKEKLSLFAFVLRKGVNSQSSCSSRHFCF
jgi:hypothetical protein